MSDHSKQTPVPAVHRNVDLLEATVGPHSISIFFLHNKLLLYFYFASVSSPFDEDCTGRRHFTRVQQYNQEEYC